MMKTISVLCATALVASLSFAEGPATASGFAFNVIHVEGDPQDPNDDVYQVVFLYDPGPLYAFDYFPITEEMYERILFEEPWGDCPWPPDCPENHMVWEDLSPEGHPDGVGDTYTYSNTQ